MARASDFIGFYINFNAAKPITVRPSFPFAFAILKAKQTWSTIISIFTLSYKVTEFWCQNRYILMKPSNTNIFLFIQDGQVLCFLDDGCSQAGSAFVWLCFYENICLILLNDYCYSNVVFDIK